MFEIGNSLRDARVRQGLELRDLEAATKIRAKYLRAIEEEQFHILPGESYVRGFLRLYAEKLGLDGQVYVDEYNSRFAHGDEPAPRFEPRSRPPATRVERHALLIALAGIVGVTVLVIAAWRFGTGTGGEGALPAGAAGPARTTGRDATTVVEGPPVTLVLTATKGPTYVSVRRRSGTGALLWEGTLQQGKPRRFTGDRLWVEIAKPQRVALTVDGRAVDPLAGRGPASILVSSAGVELEPS